MNKVICDVCGTDYPETEPRCPICDCVRAEGGQTSAGNTADGTYTYVRGGRFSKSNVKKRMKAKQMNEEALLLTQASALDEVEEPEDDDRPEDEGFDEDELDAVSNKGLIIVVIVLLLAIVAVASYLVVNYLKPITERPDMTKSTETTSQTEPSGSEDVQRIPCTSVKFPEGTVSLTEVGQTVNLKDSITREPENTTDKLQFSSGDDAVATVDQNGVVTAVATGRTVISIRCGSAVLELEIFCNFGDIQLELVTADVTLDGVFPSLQLYNGVLDPADITWTSSNESIATVKDGLVTAASLGSTVITAEYQGQTATCTVYVSQEALDKLGIGSEPGTDEPGTDEPGTDEPAVDIVLKLRYKDVTLDGVYPSLQLYKGDLNPSEITWTSSKESVATVKDGLVTAVSLGSTKITAEYQGQTVTCMVHVSQSALDKLEIGQQPDTPDQPDEPTQGQAYSLKLNGKDPKWNLGRENTAEANLLLNGTKYENRCTLTVVDAEGKTMDVTWSISDTSVLEYDAQSGKFVAKALGNVTLKATYDGVEFEALLHIV